ncbi:uncharacterized protein LOC126569364 [Anopheles aquasalis]|uniref:uncharacterized protein LOC126569364 n=1 Tax=Anopheles aquasalis TaxID=42839 RepID=UPI00215A13BA|nr:uncharacterized protein LOC126569364 [Anopheles aquasalis]
MQQGSRHSDKWSKIENPQASHRSATKKPAPENHTEKQTVSPPPSILFCCPEVGCCAELQPRTMLQHFLNDHSHLPFISINGRETMVFHFEEASFPPNTPYCLGVLAYGGRGEPASLSAPNQPPNAAGYAMSNLFLLNHHEALRHHLPVLVMGCRLTSLPVSSEDTGAALQCEEQTTVLLLWLLTARASKSHWAYLSVSDTAVAERRRTFVKIREPNPEVYCWPAGIENPLIGWNYLQLNRAEIDLLSHHGSSLIRLEVMIEDSP